MRYFIIEVTIGCTGIRDGADRDGSYLEPDEIGLSAGLSLRLANWQAEYEAEFYRNFADKSRSQRLDQEGKEIAIAIRQEIPDVKIAYWSSAFSTYEELLVSSDDGSLFWLKVN